MLQLILNPEFKVSDILTAVSIFVGIIASLYVGSGIIQQREYADKIRSSATGVVVNLERWKELHLHFFKEIQEGIEKEIDGVYVTEEEKDKIRNIIWAHISEKRAEILERIIDEQISHAYKDLYLYNPNIEELFNDIIDKLKYIDLKIYQYLLSNLQNDIWAINNINDTNDHDTDPLKNRMVLTANLMTYAYTDLINESLDPIRDEFKKMIKATDRDLFQKKIQIKNQIILPEVPRLTIEGLECSIFGEYKEANQRFADALDLDSNRPGLWGLIYMTQRDAKNANEAEIAFKKFTDLINVKYEIWEKHLK